MRAWWLLMPLVAACAGNPGANAGTEEDAGGAEVVAQAEDSTIYVDVRTPEEYRSGHVKGAILIPHDQMPQRWQELEPYRDRTMVLYCRSGRRAGTALDVLKAQGFDNVTNGGGMEQMTARGLVITTGD